MLRVAVLVFLLFSFVLGSPAAAKEADRTIAYVNARWWNGARFVPGSRYVRDGYFVPAPKGRPARTEDLHRAFVVPPYADAHNHMPGRSEDVNRIAMSVGVFYLMNPTVLASVVPSSRGVLDAPGMVDAVYSMGAITAPGGHPEGIYQDIIGPRAYPNIKPADFLGDAYHYVTKPGDIVPVLNRLQSQGAQFIKIMVLYSEEFAKRRDDPAYRDYKGLDPALVPLIVKEAHRRGLRVAAHIETAHDFRVITTAGVDEAAHVPGYAADAPHAFKSIRPYVITDADARAAAREHMVMTATASQADYEKDPVEHARMRSLLKGNLRKLKKAGVQLLIGTDGQPDAAPEEATYLVGLGIFTRTEALDALSLTTPQWIFPGRRIGRLATGYEASFLVLGGDPIGSFKEITDIRRRVKQGIELTR